MADGQLDQASTILVRYFFFYFFPLFLSPFLVRSCAIFPVLWTVSFHRLLRSFEQIYSIYSLNLEGSRPITSKFLLQSPPIRPLSNIAISLSLSCSRGSSVYSRVRVLSVSHALRQTNRSSPIAASFRRFSPAFRLDRSPGTTEASAIDARKQGERSKIQPLRANVFEETYGYFLADSTKVPSRMYLKRNGNVTCTYMSKDRPRWTTGLGTKFSSPGARRIGLATDGVARVNVLRHNVHAIRASQPRLPFYCGVAPPHLAVTCPRRDSSSLSTKYPKNLSPGRTKIYRIFFRFPFQGWSTDESSKMSRANRPGCRVPNKPPPLPTNQSCPPLRRDARKQRVEGWRDRDERAGQCVAGGYNLPRSVTLSNIRYPSAHEAASDTRDPRR